MLDPRIRTIPPPFAPTEPAIAVTPLYLFSVPVPRPGKELETTKAFSRTGLYLRERPELVGTGIVLKEPAPRRVKFVGRFKRSFSGFRPLGLQRFQDLCRRMILQLGRGGLEVIWEPVAPWIEWKAVGHAARRGEEEFTVEIQIFKPKDKTTEVVSSITDKTK